MPSTMSIKYLKSTPDSVSFVISGAVTVIVASVRSVVRVFALCDRCVL